MSYANPICQETAGQPIPSAVVVPCRGNGSIQAQVLRDCAVPKTQLLASLPFEEPLPPSHELNMKCGLHQSYSLHVEKRLFVGKTQLSMDLQAA